MLAKLNCLLLGFLFMQQAVAIPPVYKDTTVQPNVKHWTQQQFSDAYGTSDTTRALIQYYFEQKKRTKHDMMIWGSVGIAAGFAFDRVVDGVWLGYGMGALAVGILLAVAVYVGAVVLVTGIYKLLHFSRQRLLVRLQRYHGGKLLSVFLLWNRKFRRLLAIEREVSRKEKG